MAKRNLMHILGFELHERIDPRRRQEVADSRLVSEDHSAMANLPQRPVYHEYNQQRFTPHFMMINEEDEI